MALATAGQSLLGLIEPPDGALRPRHNVDCSEARFPGRSSVLASDFSHHLAKRPPWQSNRVEQEDDVVGRRLVGGGLQDEPDGLLYRRAGRQPSLPLASPFPVTLIADHGSLNLHQEAFTFRVSSVESFAIQPGPVPFIHADQIVPPVLTQRTTVVHIPLTARRSALLALRWSPFGRRLHDRPLLALSVGLPLRLPDEQTFAVHARAVDPDNIILRIQLGRIVNPNLDGLPRRRLVDCHTRNYARAHDWHFSAPSRPRRGRTSIQRIVAFALRVVPLGEPSEAGCFSCFVKSLPDTSLPPRPCARLSVCQPWPSRRSSPSRDALSLPEL